MSESDQPTIGAPAQSAGNQTAEAPPSKRRSLRDHPEHIGPYRIIEVIGEGGMGVVYKAEQREPVRRLVALKVIKLGMDTREVVARFEVERQALALMSHPNVAKVFEAGVTEQGRPYFAMEYVPGISITDYCDQNKLTTRERLELFIPVCQAVQHAHQKGIIHRDLKPGNILVSMFDGKPVPKVIDFGIAKAANQALTQKTLYTQTGALIGTPEYMSPEQAQTSGLDVDTRTDIYSLGVMLYELLTGQLPFDPAALRKSGVDGMARMIRETEPPKPSTRISLLGHDPATVTSTPEQDVARRRRSDFRSLARELRGDLDWITLKAMEKDRTRRYETANGLAVDVRRYLDNEPISAHPPSTLYRLSKTVKKHKVGVSAAAAIVLALLLGIMGTSIEMVRARGATREAQADKLRAQQAEQTAIEQRQAAEQQRVLAMRNEARADSTIARVFKMKGDLAAAAPLMRRSLEVYRQLHGGDDVEVAGALGDLAWLLQGKEHGREAEQAARDSLA
ncbi:MAG TPA: serine/threonine-protein kinase, partial [Tepidisphaeraceae bacterium]|nr:serine/threonine-protein kinase [Tepidisphaeraceae bacterium]